MLNPYLRPTVIPKSARLNFAMASAPQTSRCRSGWLGRHLKLPMVRKRGCVIPCRVKNPVTIVGAPVVKAPRVPV